MHRKGHIGASLVVYAPFGFALAALASIEAGAIVAAAVASTAMIPDLDISVPFVKHRGITHTVWFALFIGLLLAGVVAVLPLEEVGVSHFVLVPLFFVVGTLAILGHLLGDIITPQGLHPFAPVTDSHYSLALCNAKNPVANYSFLTLGIISVCTFLILVA